MLVFLKLYWRQAAIVALALVLAWSIKRYGTLQYEAGAADEKIQVTRTLEKQVQVRYAAEVKQLAAERQELDQVRQSIDYQTSAIQTERDSFNRTVSAKLSAIDQATKGNRNEVDKVGDDQLNGLARQWIERLSARQ